MFNNMDRQLAVVTTVTPWREPPRIRHQVTRQLRRFYNLLYVELPFGRRNSHSEKYERVDEGFVILRLPHMPRGFGRIWETIPAVHSMYNSHLVRKIEDAVSELGYETSALISFQHNFPQIMYSRLFKPRLYVCNDELTMRAPSKRKRRLLHRYETAVAQNADVSLAVSYPLLEKLRGITSNAIIFLPGHEFSIDRHDHVGRQSTNSKIRVAYMGYINDRLRFDWLSELVKCSDIQLTLIGPVQDDTALAGLRACDNFQLVDAKEGNELREELMMHDVLTMPYDTRQIGVQAATAPNKLFQYLACAKPIVISNMRNFIDLPQNFVYRGANATEFTDAIRQAVDDDNEKLRQARIAYAEKNTWNDRGNGLRKLLLSSFAGDI